MILHHFQALWEKKVCRALTPAAHPSPLEMVLAMTGVTWAMTLKTEAVHQRTNPHDSAVLPWPAQPGITAGLLLAALSLF